MDIHRIDPVIVDDGPKPGAGEGDLPVGIFLLQEPGVHARGKRVFPEVVQSQESGKSHPSHASQERSLLGVKPVGKNPLVPRQMEGLILI